MLRLAQQAGLTAPEGHVCTWGAKEAPSRGIIVRLFLFSGALQLIQSAAAYRATPDRLGPRECGAIRIQPALQRPRSVFRVLSGLGLGALLGNVLAIAGSVDVDADGEHRETVEDGHRDGGVAEVPTPVAEGDV